MGTTIRIVLADPHRIVLDALGERLSREPGFSVVGIAEKAVDLLALARRMPTSVIMSELQFTDGEALTVAADTVLKESRARWLLLTGVLTDVFAERAARLGVGYMLKTEPVSAVIAAVRCAAAGGIPLSTDVAKRLRFDRAAGRHVLKVPSRLAGLTPRQLEVLRRIARGQPVREVARELGLTEKGVDSHKYRIMNRLGVRDCVRLTRIAIREGIVSP